MLISEPTQTHLYGKDAARYKWKKRLKPGTGLILYKNRSSALNPKTAVRRQLVPAAEPFTLQVEHITTIDKRGSRKEFHRYVSGVEVVDNDPERCSFELANDQPPHPLSWLMLEKTDGRYRFYWIGSGECPDEYSEESLPVDHIKILLQDGHSRTCGTRTIRKKSVRHPGGGSPGYWKWKRSFTARTDPVGTSRNKYPSIREMYTPGACRFENFVPDKIPYQWHNDKRYCSPKPIGPMCAISKIPPLIFAVKPLPKRLPGVL